MNIGIAITGSFCTYSQIIKIIKEIKEKGNNIIPIVSKEVLLTNTRFGKASDFIKEIEELTEHKVVSNIVEAEPLGPSNSIDVLAIAPCTGNTLAKLANGLSDDAVTMSAKAHMRNYKPLVIGISTNDALGLNLQNIAKLLNAKNVFFVPFRQDSPESKPKSMIADFSMLYETILKAQKKEQIQPLVLGNK